MSAEQKSAPRMPNWPRLLAQLQEQVGKDPANPKSQNFPVSTPAVLDGGSGH